MPVEVHIDRIGTYNKKADETAIVNGLPNLLNEDRERYGPLKFEMDLNKGCETFKDEGYENGFHSFFDYIKKTFKHGTTLKDAIGADFISNRRNLVIFAESPYFMDWKSTDINALRKDGVIFLFTKSSEEKNITIHNYADLQNFGPARGPGR